MDKKKDELKRANDNAAALQKDLEREIDEILREKDDIERDNEKLARDNAEKGKKLDDVINEK